MGREGSSLLPLLPSLQPGRATGQASREDAVEIQGPRDCVIHTLPDVPGNKSVGEGQLRRGEGGKGGGGGCLEHGG